MISVAIVGSGNVAYHITNALMESNAVKVKQLYTRNSQDFGYWKSKLNVTQDLEELAEAEVTIIAVSDDSISEVSKNIKNSFVVHTSGAKGIDELQNPFGKGVLYPLQTFSKEKKVNVSQIPFCIEALNEKDLNKLKEICIALKSNWYHINSIQRNYLHVAAVFANNFSNHMYVLASEICKKNGVPFEILTPLILETAKKIKELEPLKAQTGPAKRNDIQTINKHLDLLTPAQKELYQKITESIQHHGKKL